MPDALRLHIDDGAAMPVPADQRDASTSLAPAAPPAPPSRPPVAFGLTPRTIDEAWRFAQMLANSEMVPKDYRGKPENVMVAMQYGAEVGLPPMAALQSVAVINGRPGLYGDGFLAVVVASPAYAGHQECYLVAGEERERVTAPDLTKDDTAAVARFWRKGRAEPFTATFSIANARKANLLGKAGPWTEYPGRMLQMRAREFAARDAFAPELRGMGMAEALRDARDEPPTIIPIGAPTRRSMTAAADDAPAPPEVPAPTGDDKQPAPTPSTPMPPRATTPGAAAASTTTTTVIIEHTAAVGVAAARGDIGHYEIKTMEHGGDERLPPPTHVFVTSDEALYKLAASCEGTGALCVATWHRGKRANGVVVKFLDSLTAAD